MARLPPILRPNFDPYKARMAPSRDLRWNGKGPLVPKRVPTRAEILRSWWLMVEGRGYLIPPSAGVPPDHPYWPEWVSIQFLADHVTKYADLSFSESQVGSFLKDQRVESRQFTIVRTFGRRSYTERENRTYYRIFPRDPLT